MKTINPVYAAEKLIERECDGDFIAKHETMNMSIGAILYLERVANGEEPSISAEACVREDEV